MLKISRMMVVFLVAIGFASVASAQGFDQRRLFFGAGLGANSVSGGAHALGAQFFTGYNLKEIAPKFSIDPEVGYMDSGKFKKDGRTVGDNAKGLWAAGVPRYMATPNLELLARVGYDFGDDDGLMFGLGGGYIVNKNLKLRLEYVARDNIDSIQFNLVFYPW
jgi:outer membrane protein with beta-barrel domain